MFAQPLPLKRLALLFSMLFVALALWAPAASAQVQTGQLCKGADLEFGKDPKACQTTQKDEHGNDVEVSAGDRVTRIVADVLNLVSVLVGVIAVLMIIYAGFRFVTSGGNPESTKSARNTILYAIVGLVIVVFAQVIVKFVLVKITNSE